MVLGCILGSFLTPHIPVLGCFMIGMIGSKGIVDAVDYESLIKLDGEEFIWMNKYPVEFYRTSVWVLKDDSFINIVSVD